MCFDKPESLEALHKETNIKYKSSRVNLKSEACFTGFEHILKGKATKSCEGAVEIYEHLDKLSDFVRLSKEIIGREPLAGFKERSNFPMIKVKFSSLPNLPEKNGNFILMDSPGPNEANGGQIKEFVNKLMGTASAVFPVIDFTQEGTDHEKKMIEDITKERQGSKDDIYVMWNKIDNYQKSENKKTIEMKKSAIANKLGLNNDQIFPISARQASFAYLAKNHIEKNDRLPNPRFKGNDWVDDFGKLAFGGSKWNKKWEQLIYDTKTIKEECEYLLEESKFGNVVKAIDTKSTKLHFSILQSAFDKMKINTDKTLTLLNKKISELEKSEETCNDEINKKEDIKDVIQYRRSEAIKSNKKAEDLYNEIIGKIKEELSKIKSDEKSLEDFLHVINKEILEKYKEWSECLPTSFRARFGFWIETIAEVAANAVGVVLAELSSKSVPWSKVIPAAIVRGLYKVALKFLEAKNDPDTQLAVGFRRQQDVVKEFVEQRQKEQQETPKAITLTKYDSKVLESKNEELNNKIIDLYKSRFLNIYAAKIYAAKLEVTIYAAKLEVKINKPSGLVSALELCNKQNHKTMNDINEIMKAYNPNRFGNVTVDHPNYFSVTERIGGEINKKIKDKIREVAEKNIFIQEGGFQFTTETSRKETFNKVFDGIEDVTVSYMNNLFKNLTEPYSKENKKLLEKLDDFEEKNQEESTAISERLNNITEVKEELSQSIKDIDQFKKVIEEQIQEFTEWRNDL